MLWVRGQARDYDGWAAELRASVPGASDTWSAAACLPRFEALERELGVGAPRCDMGDTDPGLQAFVAAAKEVGIGGVGNCGGGSGGPSLLDGARDGAAPGQSHRQEGAGLFPVTVSDRGLRSSASEAFLWTAQGGGLPAEGLEIITEATVDKLNFDEASGGENGGAGGGCHAVCTGVDFLISGERHTARLAPGGEVVVSLGAIGSPALLLRSGLGDAAAVDGASGGGHRGGDGRPVVWHHLPAVGRHMQDHCQVKAAFRTIVPTLNDRVNSPLGLVEMAARFAIAQRGPLTMAPTPAGAFARRASCGNETSTGKSTSTASAASASPDIQLLYGPWTSRSREMSGLQVFRLLDKFSAAAMTAVQLRPSSRGAVTLHPETAEPQIQPNHLDTAADQQCAVDSVRLMCRVAHAMRGVVDLERDVDSESKSMSSSLDAEEGTGRGGEGDGSGDHRTHQQAATTGTASRNSSMTFTELLRSAPPEDLSSDKLLDYAIANGTTIYHPVGSCRMGPAGDTTGSVVDPELRVHGIRGLSVADASVMPTIVSGNTNAATMMIGATAGELIGARLGQQRRHLHTRRPRRRSSSSIHRSSSSSSSNPSSSISSRSLGHRFSSTGASPQSRSVAMGFDFGTESCRVVLVDTERGTLLGEGVCAYRHGQITGELPATLTGAGSVALASHEVLQSSEDWLAAAREACSAARAAAERGHGVTARDVVGVGSCFTSCTPLPCLADGTPLHTLDRFRERVQAWPKLWKHQAAAEAVELTAAVKGSGEGNKWLDDRYGGAIGAEWMHPKALQVHDVDREVFDAAQVFVDAGDWFVHNLIMVDGGPLADTLKRSSCQAGFKACWGGGDRFPDSSIWDSVRPGFGAAMVERLDAVGDVLSPGALAGGVGPAAAEAFGLLEGTPVAVSTIDAHSGVPGAGVGKAGVLTIVMGTSGCYMANTHSNDGLRDQVAGCLGRVDGGILPGLVGLEMGQSAMGDAFAWAQRFTNTPVAELAAAAEAELLGEGAYGAHDNRQARRLPLALDWFNGCRSPHNDGALRGALASVSLSTTPGQLYLAVADGLACGGREMVRCLVDANAPVDKVVAAGGLPHVAPLLLQRFADALQRPIHVSRNKQASSVGAAIFGAVAGGAHASVEDAVAAMAAGEGDQRQQRQQRQQQQRGGDSSGIGVVVEPNVSSEANAFWEGRAAHYAELAAMELAISGRSGNQ